MSWTSSRAWKSVIASIASVCAVAAGAGVGLADAPPAQAAPATPEPSGLVDVEQALARAQRTGNPVEATGSGSSSVTVTANPDGTVAWTQSASPTRKLVDGAWRPLDATLVRRSDGTVGPTTTTHEVRLSGGGSGPLATMVSGDRSLELSFPVTLPAPTLAGATATYPDVLSGVDLQVIVSPDGGTSQVLVVRDAAAAVHPLLRTLTVATTARGFSLGEDPDGGITGRDRARAEVITAPTPAMWDSTRAPAAARATAAEPPADPDAASTALAPGAGAKVAPVATAVGPDGITLTPDRALLNGADTVFPVFIDPTFTWSSAGAAKSGWATISRNHQSTNYWNNTPDPNGRMQVGNAGSQWSHTLINFPIPVSTLSGATINSATFKITNVYSYSCTDSRVNLYAPATVLSRSNATWNHWENISYGAVVAYKSFAHGYNSGCPAAAESFDITPEIRADVTNGKTTQTLILTGNHESGDLNSWKKFLETSPTLTILYNHRPTKPTGMKTSPQTDCTAATPTVVGDGSVSLYAPVSDRNGGVLGVSFKLWKTSDTTQTAIASSNPNLLTYPSGRTAVLVVPVSTLRTAAGGTLTGFSWKVQATDFNLTSDWSATCRFTFDPTRTGAPQVTPPAGPTIGQPATVTITGPTTGTTPTSYLLQLNAGPPIDVAAGANGNASVEVTPTRYTNILTITGLSTGGNIGDAASITFNADPAAISADADLTGDGIRDLLAVGGNHGLPAGLWLAPGGNTNPHVAGTNIGARGNGLTGAHSPADFTGAQILTGRFTGSGIQDVLAYYPGGANPGTAVILYANGDGSIIQSQLDGNVQRIDAAQLTDEAGNSPLRLASAGDSRHIGSPHPDLIGVSGDSDGGYFLAYYPNYGNTGAYVGGLRTTATTPAGGTDWNNWTIATAQQTSGTAMFLWNRTTGALHLWTDLTANPDTAQLTYTSRTLSTNWNRGADVSLRAADINADGTADLWTVGTGATSTAWLVTGLTATAGTINAQTPKTILTANHAWQLNDATEGPTATAHDTSGTLHATGTSGVTWSTGDTFDPDAVFDGTTNNLTTAGPAVTTNTDFTVSTWAKPTVTGGTTISQDGTNTAGFRLWAEPSDKSWRFAMPRTDVASPVWDTATAGANTVRPGVWTQVTASYDASARLITLYLNGVYAGQVTHATAWNATGRVRIGSARTSATTIGAHFAGEMAYLQTWNNAWTIADPVNGTVAWYPFTGTTAIWHCTTTTDRGDYTEQHCTIVNGLQYQAAFILQSKQEKNYAATAQNVNSGQYEEYRVCSGTVAPGTKVVCYSPTIGGTSSERVQGYFIDPNKNGLYSPTIAIS